MSRSDCRSDDDGATGAAPLHRQHASSVTVLKPPPDAGLLSLRAP
jgi:hypothetical protein